VSPRWSKSSTGNCSSSQRQPESLMRVFTPDDIRERAANKYLGVLVAAKQARMLNEFPRERTSREKKLTTRSLEELSEGQIEYRVVARRRDQE